MTILVSHAIYFLSNLFEYNLFLGCDVMVGERANAISSCISARNRSDCITLTHRNLRRIEKEKNGKTMHWPGIGPGSPAWQASILPLNHQCLLSSFKCIKVNMFISFSFSLLHMKFYVKQVFGIGNWGNHGASKNGGGFALKNAGPCLIDGPVAKGRVSTRRVCVTNHPNGAGNRIGRQDSIQHKNPCTMKNKKVDKMDGVSLNRINAI